jgi:sialate O-acetylesterase
MLKLLLLHLVFIVTASAELKVASIFQDHMVLQRKMVIPVWGWAKANSSVTVSFNQKSLEAKVDPQGKWQIALPKLNAGGPYEMLITNNDTSIKLTDILVGEVWICSGQSNMQMGHRAIPNYKSIIQESSKLPIRSFTVENFVAFDKQETCNGTWQNSICNSAVAASFSYHLQKALNVPVGIIQASWGSSSIEGWMPLELTQELPHYKKIMEDFNKTEKPKVAKLLEDCRNDAGKLTWSGQENIYMRTRPNIIYNAMMHPLIPFACRGLVWYQGEANTKNLESMHQYSHSLQTWVRYLRQVWNKEDFQIMPVMLPRFGRSLKGGASTDATHPAARSWAWFREAQLGLLDLPGTAIVNTIDLGEAKNIHPKDKLPIGQRLSLLALKNIHGKDIISQGPIFKKATFNANKVTICYEFNQGLKTTNGKAPSSFWIAGKDKLWHKATAKIVGSEIELSSPEVKQVLAVRYAFAAFPEVNLINNAHLPALPFRTDKWLP